MAVRSLVVTVALATAWLPVTPASAAPHASIQPFVRDWLGHTRILHLHADGTAVESIYAGCCDHVVDVTLRVSRGRGDRHRGSVFARVTKVRVFDPGAYPGGSAPRVGDRGRIEIRRGVLREPFTHTIYCTPAAGRRGVCGA